MSYALKHDSVLDIAEVVFTGLITGTDLSDSTTQCTSLQKQTGTTRFLVDANDWDMGASLVQIFNLPDEQYWKEGLNPKSRIAVILPGAASTQDAARFYEAACQNRGWNAKVCPDRQSAIAWLMS